MLTRVTKQKFTRIKLNKGYALFCFLFLTNLVMVRAYEKVRAKNYMPRASPSFQKARLDRAELLKTRGSRA